MYLIINKWVTSVKVSNFSGHYLRNRSTLVISVYFNIRNTLPKSGTFLLGHLYISVLLTGDYRKTFISGWICAKTAFCGCPSFDFIKVPKEMKQCPKNNSSGAGYIAKVIWNKYFKIVYNFCYLLSIRCYRTFACEKYERSTND